MGAMKVGRGTEEDVKVGPLIDDNQRSKVAELVEDAARAGRAGASSAGPPRDGAGYFYEPTVLADVPADARLLKEEIFGPVAPVDHVRRPRRRRSPRPTTPSTASSPTSSPATSAAPSA